MEQQFEYAVSGYSKGLDGVSSKSISAAVDSPENTDSGAFECNICLDFVQDPVVTFCGHLYCWPCIYKWIYFRSQSAQEPDRIQPQCPVCKAEISQRSLVPLYGRGQTTKLSKDKAQHLGLLIPKRPPSLRCRDQRPSSHLVHQSGYHSHTHQRQPHYHDLGSYAAPLPNINVSNMYDPMIGMFGEMFCAGIFGNSHRRTLHAYPNSYHIIAGSGNRRMRRRMIEVERSLSRVCFFLCCCVTLCLLLF